MACKKQTFFSVFTACLQCLYSLCSTQAGNRPYGKPSSYSCMLSIPPPISSLLQQHVHSCIEEKSGVNHRDTLSPGTFGHSRMGGQSRCLSLSLRLSDPKPSWWYVVSTHAQALVQGITLTKIYSYRSCPWRLSVSAVSAVRGQSWLVTRSGSASIGQTINLSCVPADLWAHNSPNALFFKWAELTLVVH